MDHTRSKRDTVNQTVKILESVDNDLTSFFDEKTETTSFFKIRSELLTNFQQLAINLHQTNNLRYLNAGALASDMFSSELNTINMKIMEIRGSVLESLDERLLSMHDYRDILQRNDNQLIAILNSLDSKTESTVQLRVFIKNDNHRKQSLIYTIEDTRSKIILPAIQVLTEEIEAADKVIDALEIVLRDNEDPPYSLDELARICEMLAMGLEGTSLWEDIKASLKENDLKREVVSLRPHGVLEETELDNFMSYE